MLGLTVARLRSDNSASSPSATLLTTPTSAFGGPNLTDASPRPLSASSDSTISRIGPIPTPPPPPPAPPPPPSSPPPRSSARTWRLNLGSNHAARATNNAACCDASPSPANADAGACSASWGSYVASTLPTASVNTSSHRCMAASPTASRYWAIDTITSSFKRSVSSAAIPRSSSCNRSTLG